MHNLTEKVSDTGCAFYLQTGVNYLEGQSRSYERDNARLRVDLETSERRIRELEREVRSFKERTPNLRIIFF